MTARPIRAIPRADGYLDMSCPLTTFDYPASVQVLAAS